MKPTRLPMNLIDKPGNAISRVTSIPAIRLVELMNVPNVTLTVTGMTASRPAKLINVPFDVTGITVSRPVTLINVPFNVTGMTVSRLAVLMNVPSSV